MNSSAGATAHGASLSWVELVAAVVQFSNARPVPDPSHCSGRFAINDVYIDMRFEDSAISAQRARFVDIGVLGVTLECSAGIHVDDRVRLALPLTASESHELVMRVLRVEPGQDGQVLARLCRDPSQSFAPPSSPRPSFTPALFNPMPRNTDRSMQSDVASGEGLFMATATPSEAASGSSNVSLRWVEMMSRLVSHFYGRPAPITAASPIRYQLRQVFGTMQLEPLSQPPVDVELVDISSRGVCLLCEAPLQVGQRLTLHIPDPAGRSTGWSMIVAHVGVLADGKTRAGLMRDS